MRRILESILLPLSRAVLGKYRPVVVAVTGTVGKTSAKRAIAAALAASRTVRASRKNDNTEIGAAVTVLGVPAAGRSVLGWCRALATGVRLLVAPVRDYPSTLVLEFGAQRPGDVSRLCALFPPTVGVLTAIGATHAEGLGGIAGVEREKGALLAALPKDGFAIVNADDQRTLALASRTKARVIRYGLSDTAQVRGIAPRLDVRRDENRGLFVDGMAFKIQFDGTLVPAVIPGSLGNPPILAGLAGVAVAKALGANALPAIEALRAFEPQKGHLRVLDGIKFSTVLDDTYNASTASMIEALRALRMIPLDEGEERIAVLGEMREMGSHSEEEHRAVGRAVAENEVDRLVTVGERARDIMRGARAAGFPEERATHFADTEAAGRFVQSILERGDLVLVKGSRGMHLEAVVKELMAEPLRAEELLEWGEPTT